MLRVGWPRGLRRKNLRSKSSLIGTNCDAFRRRKGAKICKELSVCGDVIRLRITPSLGLPC